MKIHAPSKVEEENSKFKRTNDPSPQSYKTEDAYKSTQLGKKH